MESIPAQQLKTLNFRSLVPPLVHNELSKPSMVVYQTATTRRREARSDETSSNWQDILNESYLLDLPPPPMCYGEDKKFLVEFAKSFAIRHGYKLVVNKNDGRRCILLCDQHAVKKNASKSDSVGCSFRVELQFKTKKRYWLLKPIKPRHGAHGIRRGSDFCTSDSHLDCAFEVGLNKSDIPMDDLPVISREKYVLNKPIADDTEIDEVLRNAIAPPLTFYQDKKSNNIETDEHRTEIDVGMSLKVVVKGQNSDLSRLAFKVIEKLSFKQWELWPRIPVECSFVPINPRNSDLIIEISCFDETERSFSFDYVPDQLDYELDKIKGEIVSMVSARTKIPVWRLS
ncbi:unnamed protein product [Kuraishia capsulata CBS 1993]|uniref:Uncharacterized protein n=1 Tax=Kuraishia capsulata CBS 1993 TaxID=1382522 RepID=W6MPB5_9ASCO|nr:uncharacterized protein KUCA_T00004469001 [Kuraishia capsulata CBS 1993]CDK28486.1 unnamed protein product [Kuraishia capsulata CBS 1993]